jgi:signal transduction histidine kinase
LARIAFIWVFLFYTITGFTQFDKDSTYSYQELNKILDLARTNNDNSTLADVYIKLGDYEGDVFSEYEKSLRYYNYALEHFKATKNEKGIKQTNYKIAVRYINAGFFNDAINMLSALANDHEKNNEISSLSNVYFHIHRAYRGLGDYEKSLQNLQKTIELNKIVKDTALTINILFDRVQAFELSYELDSALVDAYKAFTFCTQANKLDLAAKGLFHIGYVNKLKKDYPRALKYLEKSLDILPFSPYNELRMMIYKELGDINQKIGNTKDAYNLLLRYTLLNDSIHNKNKLESFTNLALKYGSKEKQTSIELLKIEKEYEIAKNAAQKRTLYILGIGLFIVLLSIYFIIKFYDQQISTTKIITEQKEEINQRQIRELEDNIKMSSMKSVIEGQEIERERIAKDLHDSLGGLLSTIKLQFDHVSSINHELSGMKEYTKAHQLLDTAVEEVRTISRNLQPGALQNLGLVSAIKDLINRFEGENYPEIDFQYYEMPEKMDKMISLSIYRIVQELFSNSIKHADANEILIQLNTEEDELVIQYEDDGIGFDQHNLKRKGMGLENIKSRVNYMLGTITIDSEKDQGMAVMIRVKYL